MAHGAPSASETAYKRLRDGIIDGTYVPGEMLGEAHVATEFGMSRTPVRVALARLQDEGWIVVYPKRGALVQGMSETEIADLADARLLLESTSVARASHVRRTELADRLTLLIEEQREELEARDLPRFITLTQSFHRGFVETSDNAVLIELYDRLADRQRFSLYATGPGMMARSEEILAEHRALVEHLRAGEAGAFADLLHDHIEETRPIPAPDPDGVGRASTMFG